MQLQLTNRQDLGPRVKLKGLQQNEGASQNEGPLFIKMRYKQVIPITFSEVLRSSV